MLSEWRNKGKWCQREKETQSAQKEAITPTNLPFMPVVGKTTFPAASFSQCISFKDNREKEYFSPSFDRVVERRASLLTSSKRQGSCSQLSVMSATPKVIDLLCNHRFRLGWAVVSFFSMYFYSSEMRYGMFIWSLYGYSLMLYYLTCSSVTVCLCFCPPSNSPNSQSPVEEFIIISIFKAICWLSVTVICVGRTQVQRPLFGLCFSYPLALTVLELDKKG